MSKSNLMIISIISILIALSIGLFTGIALSKDDSNQFSNKESSSDDPYLLDIFRGDIMLQYENDTHHLSPQILLSGEGIKNVPLKDIKIEDNTLVVRYSYLNCNDCINYVLELIKSNSILLQKKNVIILGTYQTQRDAYIYKKLNNLSCKVFHVTDSILPIDKANMPYFFIVDKEKRISHTFIPRKEKHDICMDHLSVSAEMIK